MSRTGLPRGVWLAALAVALLCLTGCGVFVAPSPTPAAMDDVIAGLVLRGVTVEHLTSGDAGCPGSQLYRNGVHFTVATASDSPSYDVFLLRWDTPAEFAARSDAFTACVGAYSAAHPGASMSQIEVTPWRAYGPDWPAGLAATLESALHAAGGG
jgi:hypothetical protein